MLRHPLPGWADNAELVVLFLRMCHAWPIHGPTLSSLVRVAIHWMSKIICGQISTAFNSSAMRDRPNVNRTGCRSPRESSSALAQLRLRAFQEYHDILFSNGRDLEVALALTQSMVISSTTP